VRSADFWPLVPVEAEPAEAVEDPVDHLGRRAIDVGVLDAQDKGAAVPARVEPVEQRRACAADMQIPSWGGGETNAWYHGGIIPRRSTALPVVPTSTIAAVMLHV